MPSRRTDQWRCSLILLALSRFSQNIHVASCPVPIFATPRSHQAKPNASPVEADMDLMLEMKSHYQTEIGWNRLDTCIISYSYIYIYIYICFRVPCCHPPPTPPPMVWVQNLHLATFSWNPPKHMVFTMF